MPLARAAARERRRQRPEKTKERSAAHPPRLVLGPLTHNKPTAGAVTVEGGTSNKAAQRRGAPLSHPNEQRLRHLYGRLDAGDLDAFLGGCTDDATFLIPGDTSANGLFTKEAFRGLLAPIIDRSGGRFLQHVLAIAANDDQAIVLLFHRFCSEGGIRQYRTAHHLELRNGRIAALEEYPGCQADFESAWGGERGTYTRTSPSRIQAGKASESHNQASSM
jgi:ketosteroid isomerase-like protein